MKKNNLVQIFSRIGKQFFSAPTPKRNMLLSALFITGILVLLFVTQFSDQRIHASTSPTLFTFSAGGDFGGNADTSVTLDQINSTAVNFHLMLGDLSYGEIAPESAWCSYVKSHLTNNMPVELIAGNHEDGGETTGHGLIDNFTQCLPDAMNSKGTYGKEYYFDYPLASPAARFIMVSPGLTFTNGGAYDYSAGTSHYTWVASAIDDARAKHIPWIIVGMHKVCLSMGSEPCEIGNDLMNLLVSKKVDLVLQGHDHTYQRSKQLALNTSTCTAIQAETYNSNCVVNTGASGSYPKGAGTIFMIIGTGGRPLSDVVTSDQDLNYFATWMGNNVSATFGFNKFSISADQLSATSSFYGTSAPANFTDSFSITGSGTATPTPTPTPQPTTTTTVNIDNSVVGTGINQWSYVGNWSTCSGCDSWDNVVNDTAKLTFSGTQVTYKAAINSTNGIVGVSIDGGPETMVDLYSASTVNNTPVWTSPVLANTTHTLTVRVTGTHNASASDAYASVYSADVTTQSTPVTQTPSPTLTPTPTSTLTPTPTPTLPAATPTPSPTASAVTPIMLRSPSVTNANGGGSQSLSLAKPSGLMSNDVMIAQIVVRSAGASITPPAGWSLIRRDNTSSAMGVALYVKVAGASEPSSYTFSFDASYEAVGSITAYYGVNTSSPIDASSSQYNDTVSTMTAPAVQTSYANDRLLWFGAVTVYNTTITIPSGMTSRYTQNNGVSTGVSAVMSDQLIPTAGATGSRTGSNSAGKSNISDLVALHPAQ